MSVLFNGWLSKVMPCPVIQQDKAFLMKFNNDITGGFYMATIYCFSSTGNSLYTSKKIAQKIGAEIKSMLIRNEKCDDDVIGFVFPCYCWGLPNSVEKFLNELEITNKNAYIFTVVTYGGTIVGIMGLVENIMKIKGLHVTYGRIIKCVENYNISFKVNNTPEMQQKSEKNINLCAEEISKRI